MRNANKSNQDLFAKMEEGAKEEGTYRTSSFLYHGPLHCRQAGTMKSEWLVASEAQSKSRHAMRK